MTTEIQNREGGWKDISSLEGPHLEKRLNKQNSVGQMTMICSFYTDCKVAPDTIR